MTTTPKRGPGRIILIVVIVLLAACVVCGIVGYFVVLKPAASVVSDILIAPKTTGEEFMTAVTAKDYTKAYGMIDPSQQTAFGGSPDGMQQMFESKGLEPTKFELTDSHYNGTSDVSGTGTFNGATKYIYINLGKNGDAWKIFHLEVSDNAPTPTPASGG